MRNGRPRRAASSAAQSSAACAPPSWTPTTTGPGVLVVMAPPRAVLPVTVSVTRPPRQGRWSRFLWSRTAGCGTKGPRGGPDRAEDEGEGPSPERGTRCWPGTSCHRRGRLAPDDMVDDALRLLVRREVTSLPVVDGDAV